MDKNEKMALIFNKLSNDSQSYLLVLANMAKVAECGKEKETGKLSPADNKLCVR